MKKFINWNEVASFIISKAIEESEGNGYYIDLSEISEMTGIPEECINNNKDLLLHNIRKSPVVLEANEEPYDSSPEICIDVECNALCKSCSNRDTRNEDSCRGCSVWCDGMTSEPDVEITNIVTKQSEGLYSLISLESISYEDTRKILDILEKYSTEGCSLTGSILDISSEFCEEARAKHSHDVAEKRNHKNSFS